MMKKVILIIMLFAISGVLFATFRPEKAKMARPVEVSEEIASGARDFTRELLEYARKNDHRKFAEYCHDISASNLAADYRQMRKLKLGSENGSRVYTLNGEVYRIAVVDSKDFGFECCLLFDDEKSEWKFRNLDPM